MPIARGGTENLGRAENRTICSGHGSLPSDLSEAETGEFALLRSPDGWLVTRAAGCDTLGRAGTTCITLTWSAFGAPVQ